MATSTATPKPEAEAEGARQDDGAEDLPDGLWPRLLLAQQAVDVVGKEGRNDFHGYDYAKAEDVIRASARALQGAGLVGYVKLLPPDEGGYVEEAGQTSNGAPSKMVTVRGSLCVRDPESGEEVDFDLYGTGVDTPGDKAFYKAMTGGKKYAYASALQIGFGDDPEDGTTPGGKASYAAPAELPSYAKQATEASTAKVATALELLCELPGEEPEATKARAEAVLQVITEDEGGGSMLTRAAARAILHAATRVRADAESAAAEEPVPWEAGDDDAEPLPPAPPRKEDPPAEVDRDPIEQAEAELDPDAVLDDDAEGGDAASTS